MSNTAVLIAGDGSDRNFYRDVISNKKCILMQYPSWEGGHGGTPERWLRCQESLKEFGILVPEIYDINKEKAQIFIEDLGDKTLENIFCEDKPNALKYYETALKNLVDIQEPKNPIPHPGEELAFDEEKLWYEMNFFETHFLNGLCLPFKSVWDPLFTTVKKELLALCQWESAQTRVLCHRDYHSRNLMIHNGALYWIDFQDMRMGPKTYDVASLLRDSYVSLNPAEQENLFDFYVSHLNARREEKKLHAFDYEEMLNEYVRVTWQRQLKALGSFGYLTLQKKKPLYKDYVGTTIQALCESQWTEKTEKYLNKIAPSLQDFAQLLKTFCLG